MLAGIIAVLVVLPLSAVALLLGWRVGNAVVREMRVASTPVPTPLQISTQLEAEWNRPVTVIEVAAVHQMLTARRNEALMSTGLVLGGLYVLDHGDL